MVSDPFGANWRKLRMGARIFGNKDFREQGFSGTSLAQKKPDAEASGQPARRA
jgi:hypothetical protein